MNTGMTPVVSSVRDFTEKAGKTEMKIAKPLDVDDYMEIGYILPDSVRSSALTVNYIEILKKICSKGKKKR